MASNWANSSRCRRSRERPVWIYVCAADFRDKRLVKFPNTEGSTDLESCVCNPRVFCPTRAKTVADQTAKRVQDGVGEITPNEELPERTELSGENEFLITWRCQTMIRHEEAVGRRS